ncbi:MAG: KH domain-containing protein [Patescibacteria group bacterium]|nr:KH domain-containing protein [Patescibacteria group bacterium]MDD4304146.1 KH domain-containing protein [Patescibacteria group bacterium]MDD4695177.1 KH domain-containing protein [Patescibacteria group bacterium]
MSERDKEFLESLVKFLVDSPDKVKATRTVDEMGVLLTLDVDPNDMGQIIGRRGNTARAIRTLLRVVGAKNNARVNLKINQPEGVRVPSEYNSSEHHSSEHRGSEVEASTSDVDDLKL